MRKIVDICNKVCCFVLSAAMVFMLSSIFCACTANNKYDGQLLRLHVRANSNRECDQAVKLKVRDALNEYIAATVNKSTFEAAYADIALRLDELRSVAQNTLAKHGFGYGASVRLGREYFPARRYADVTLDEGYYDALIVELGAGEGDNWWCVVYPPLCYGEEFEYKSFFAELFS